MLNRLLDILLRRRRAEGYPGKGVLGRPEPLRRAVVDREKCTGCGDCQLICHYRRIRLRRDGVSRVASGCAGCGACERMCEHGAITMVLTGSSANGTEDDG